MKLNLEWSPGRVGWLLFMVATYLALQSLAAEYVLERLVPGGAYGGLIPEAIDLLSVNAEGTIPTWYATVLILAAAVVLGIIAAIKQRRGESDRFYWWGLAAVFLYLSIDEGAAIHEIFSDPVQETFQTSGYLEFGWLVVFVPLVLLFVAVYSRFLWRLPPPFRNLFILAGVVYVGGAVFVEAVSANRWSLDGGVTFTYLAIATVEEWLEMVGMTLFLATLLRYMRVQGYGVGVEFANRQTAMQLGRRWVWLIVAAVVALNVAIFGWAASQEAGPVPLEDVPFYRVMAQRYEGQGVVILGIEGGIDEPQAAALLTLFDDVLVVDLPSPQLAIAFAAGVLPFDEAALVEQLQVSGESNYEVFDRGELEALVGE